MEGMGGVFHDAVGFAGASCKENIQDGEERGTDDLCDQCSLSVVGSCGQQHSSSHTRQ